MYKIENKIYPCNTSLAMKFIGGKWKSVILIHLIDKPKRYNELKKEITIITERTLSLQLKQLEKDGLINRKVHTKKPPLKVVYTLTYFGKKVIPVLLEISKLGSAIAKTHKDVNVIEMSAC